MDRKAKTLHVWSPRFIPRDDFLSPDARSGPRSLFAGPQLPSLTEELRLILMRSVSSQRGWRPPRPEPDDISHTFRHRVPVTEPMMHANEGPAVLEFCFFFCLRWPEKKKRKWVSTLTQEVQSDVLQKQGDYKVTLVWCYNHCVVSQRVSLP